MKKEPIFKIGDMVRCIETPPNPNITERHGSGWRKGLEFEITMITNPDIPIYWRGYGGNGVYQDYLELVVFDDGDSALHRITMQVIKELKGLR